MNPTHIVVEAFQDLLECTETPDEANSIIIGVLANTVAAIADPAWKEMMEASRLPCDNPDCNCQIVKGNTLAALDGLRNDHRTYFAQKKGLN